MRSISVRSKRRPHRATGQPRGLGSKHYDPEKAAEVRRKGGIVAGTQSATKFDTLRGRAARRRALLRKGFEPVIPVEAEVPPPDPNFFDTDDEDA